MRASMANMDVGLTTTVKSVGGGGSILGKGAEIAKSAQGFSKVLEDARGDNQTNQRKQEETQQTTATKSAKAKSAGGSKKKAVTKASGGREKTEEVGAAKQKSKDNGALQKIAMPDDEVQSSKDGVATTDKALKGGEERAKEVSTVDAAQAGIATLPQVSASENVSEIDGEVKGQTAGARPVVQHAADATDRAQTAGNVDGDAKSGGVAAAEDYATGEAVAKVTTETRPAIKSGAPTPDRQSASSQLVSPVDEVAPKVQKTGIESLKMQMPKDGPPNASAQSVEEAPAAAPEKSSTTAAPADPTEVLGKVQMQLQVPGAGAAAGTVHVPTPAPGQQAQVPAEVHFAQANHASIISGVRANLLPHGGSMQIRLDPPELGALQVSIEMRDGVMNATFQTSNDDATRLLSHSLGQLKNALESQGVTVEKIQVQQAPRDQQSHNPDDRRQGQGFEDRQAQQQEQQRREALRRMWRRISGGRDPVDLVA